MQAAVCRTNIQYTAVSRECGCRRILISTGKANCTLVLVTAEQQALNSRPIDRQERLRIGGDRKQTRRTRDLDSF